MHNKNTSRNLNKIECSSKIKVDRNREHGGTDPGGGDQSRGVTDPGMDIALSDVALVMDRKC